LAGAGVVTLIAAAQSKAAEDIIALGSALFCVGILLVALGFYLRARKLSSEYQISGAKDKKIDRKTERICSICNQDSAQVFCRVHVLRLCLNCLDKHDDGRNCLYVPAKRAAAAYK